MNVNVDCIFGFGVDKILLGFLEVCGVVVILVEFYCDFYIDVFGVIV